MNPSLPLAALTLSATLLAVQMPARAGTIVNIQAYTDGPSVGSGVDNPFVTVGSQLHFTNAVTLDLKAGDYTIRDAWGQSGALYDAWNFQSNAGGSWTDHFFVGAWVSGDRADAVYTLLLDALPGTDTGHFGGFYDEDSASAAFLSHPAFSLHLDQDTVVGFAAPDYYLPDNLGGISIEISGPATSAVPEPSIALMAGGGLLALGAARRRRARMQD